MSHRRDQLHDGASVSSELKLRPVGQRFLEAIGDRTEGHCLRGLEVMEDHIEGH
jgi:hypothetical protein